MWAVTGKRLEYLEQALQSNYLGMLEDPTHRLPSSSLLGLPCRILSMNHKKELLRSLWVLLFIIQKSEGVDSRAWGFRDCSL